MNGMEFLIVVPIAIVATYFLLKFKAQWARKAIESHLQSNNIDAVIEKVGIPPLRLWFSNRKGDSWARLRYADGAVRWARLRSRWGNRSLELFD